MQLSSAGTGKSYCTKWLVNHYLQKGLRVATAASSGCAACILNAPTAHSLLGLPPDLRKYQSWPTSHKRHAAVKEADVFIIDEFSMLSQQMLNHIIYRIQSVKCPRGNVQDMLKKARPVHTHESAPLRYSCLSYNIVLRRADHDHSRRRQLPARACVPLPQESAAGRLLHTLPHLSGTALAAGHQA